MRRVPLPALVAALAGGVYLIAAPATADMAAHTFRAWLAEETGFPLWNAQWYGGHPMAGYSLLFPPAAALLGARLVGVLATIAAVWAFTAVAARLAPSPRAERLAAWLFCAGMISNLVVGRMPFALGVAFAIGAWACVTRSRALAALLALASVWASPVAGVFTCAAALAVLGAARGRGATAGDAAALGGPALLGGGVMLVAFPEGGTDRFVASVFWPTLLVCLGALALLDPGRRAIVWGAALYVVILVVAFAVPNPVGQTALRPGLLLGPALLMLAARPRAPVAALAVVVVALLYLDALPAVRAVSEARGDPSTSAAYYAEVLDFLEPRARPGERVEVPLTRNHWEAAHLARSVPLARGWHRQLDRKVNPLFFDDEPLTPDRYARWLRGNAVRWVALPAVPLDFSAQDERRLILAGQPFLRPVHASSRWRIWEVADPAPPASGPGRVTAVHPDGFDLEATAGTVLVRQRATPYWAVVGGDACVAEDDASGWTRVDVRRAGLIRVRARFSLARVLDHGPRCSG